MAEFKELMDAVKEHKTMLIKAVEKQDEQIALFGRATEATGAEVKKHHDQLVALQPQLKAAIDRMDVIEKKMGRAGFADLAARAAAPSVGAQFIAHPAYKSMGGADQFPGKIRQQITGMMRKAAAPNFAVYNDGTTGGADGAAATDYMRSPGILDMPMETMRIRDLLGVAPINTDLLRYVREVGYFNLHTVLTSAVIATATTIPVANANGFFVGQRITLRGGTAEQATISAVNTTTNVLTVSAALAQPHASGTDVVSDVFAGSPEVTLKPNSKIALEDVQAPVITLAHGIPASRQILDDASRLQEFLDTKMMDGLATAEDYQILYGGGGSTQLQGLMPNAGAAFNWSAMAVGKTKVDAIRRAARIVRQAQYAATGVILSPVEWEEIETAKASDGHYLYTVQATPRGPRLWGMAIAESTAIAEGSALVGAFGLAAKLYDRQQGSIQIFDQHEDFAQRNLVYILAEERLVLEISRPNALCKIAFDSAPA